MFCTRCGKETTDDNTFCVHCGSAVQSAVSTDIRPDDRGEPKDHFKRIKQVITAVDILLSFLAAWYFFTH